MVLDPRKSAELSFDGYPFRAGHLDYFSGHRDILVERKIRAVDHDGGEPSFDALLDDTHIFSVIEMQRELHLLVIGGGIHERDYIAETGVFYSPLRDGKYHRAVQLLRSVGYRLDEFHVIDIECSDSVPSGLRRIHQLFICDKHNILQCRVSY